jgi:uncharacterized protein (TIGR00288 family)
MPLPANAIVNWLGWLEDGVFDEGKPRQFLLKRVYWNAAAEKNREAYESHGFEAIHCDRYHGLPNSVDMRMAVDIVEATYVNPKVEEFILITRDSDFVPVLQRLDEKKKRTVFVANESQFNTYTTYRQHADVIIPTRVLNAARQYTRPKNGLLGRIGKSLRSQKPSQSPQPAQPAPPPPSTTDPMQQAVDRVIKVTSLNPNEETSQAKIVAGLKAVPGFTTSGKESYLGKGTYKALMKEVARRDSRIKVVDKSRGGTGVRYVPKAEA